MKRGDTFAFISALTDDLGSPIIGIALKLKSEVRSGNNVKLSDFVITETDTPGSYLFKVEDTTTWPINVLYFDIQYSDSGITTSSETICISVEKDVTL